MDDDALLLREFVQRRDEASFRRLVERRIGFVYAISLRRLRNAHLAQDATQAVFVALARKAESVSRGPSIMGWLHRSSCFESRNLMRAQFNRLARESEAERLGTTIAVPAAGGPPGQLEAILDEVLNELPEDDRQAILERYFSQRTFAEIGAGTGRTENAARMRVDRALAKLRDHLERRGFKSSTAVLASLLPPCAAAAVPGGLAGSVSAAAFAAAVAAPAAVLISMSTTKVILVATGALAAVGITGFEMSRNRALEEELSALRQQNTQANASLQGLAEQVAQLKNQVAAKATPAGGGAGAAGAPQIAATSIEIKGVTRGAPSGWHKNGSNPGAFDVGVDENESWGGMPSAYAKSTSADAQDGFGGMMQSTAAEQYKGKRVRLSGWVKTQDVQGGGQLWLRVDGQTADSMLGFDNMQARRPSGTTDWREYSIVLEVPPEATSLNYGFFLNGTGKMWVNAVTLQPVGDDVPTTNMLNARRELPPAPVNLGFKPKSAGG